MPTHITIENSINDFDQHAIQTATFTNTHTINAYDVTLHNGASLVARIGNGTDSERFMIECGHDGVSTAVDTTSLLLVGDYLDLTITSAIVGDEFQITLTDTDTVSTKTLKYYVMPSNL